VADGEVEVAGLEEILFDTEHEAGEVSFAELGDDDADGIGEAGAKHASVDVGTILELLRSIDDPLASLGRDGLGYWRVIENDGDGRGRKVKILGEDLEGDGFACIRDTLAFGHRTPKMRTELAAIVCHTKSSGELLQENDTRVKML